MGNILKKYLGIEDEDEECYFCGGTGIQHVYFYCWTTEKTIKEKLGTQKCEKCNGRGKIKKRPKWHDLIIKKFTNKRKPTLSI